MSTQTNGGSSEQSLGGHFPPTAYRAALAAVLVAASVLGLFRLGTPGVWLDEASSWYNVRGSWAHVWQRALEAEDTGGILYSALLKTWVGAAGTSEAALRLPGVLLLLVLIAVMARAASLTAGRWAGVCTAAVTLGHPSILPAARQARGYILLMALTAVCVLGLASWTSGRRRAGAWAATLAGLCAAATHVFGVFVALGAALALVSLAARDTRTAIKQALVALPAVLFAAAWAVAMGGGIRRNLASFWIPGSAVANYAAVAAWLVAPFAAAVAVASWLDDSAPTRRTLWALVLFAVPVALGPGVVSGLSPGTGHFVMVRYVIALVPLGVLAAGLALARLPRPAAAALLAVLLGGSIGYSVTRNVYSAETRNGQDTRAAASFLRERLEPGDRLFVEPFNDWMVLEYYGVRTIPDAGPTRGWRIATGTPPAHAPATWLVRFSRRTLLKPDEASRVKESWTFGTITVSLAAP